MSQNRGTLYLVATPIGNLEDVTRRALRVLGEADVVACEDTRRTRSLLEHFGIRVRTVSYHEHNRRQRPGLPRGARVRRAELERRARPRPDGLRRGAHRLGPPDRRVLLRRLPARAQPRAP